MMTSDDLVREVDGEITIRRATTIADYRACQDAQRRAWGIDDDGYLIPVATMVGANLHGGLVLGAFLPSSEAVALSFAFLGRTGGRLCLYSQLTGVVPSHQSRGLGYQIKLLQRDFARSAGLELIVWAFDPLQAGNAHFNLARLGATADRLIANMYGERSDSLNAGVPTDRLIAVWNTVDKPPAPLSAVDLAGIPRLIETEAGDGDGPGCATVVPMEVRAPGALEAPRLLLEIPPDIGQLRREQPALAERWREAAGQAFQLAFSRSYRAVHFLRDHANRRIRAYYLLERLQ
jgi:predicted GNAT superfamily acetyltransferase